MSESDTGLTVQLREQMEQTKEEGGVKLREQFDEKTTQAGQETRKLADALRRSGTQLRVEGGGSGNAARMTSAVADRLDSAGRYLERASGDDVLRDAERFARERPWVVAAGAAAVGFVASRLLKASSDRRYSAGGASSTREWQTMDEQPTVASARGTEPAYSAGVGS